MLFKNFCLYGILGILWNVFLLTTVMGAGYKPMSGAKPFSNRLWNRVFCPKILRYLSQRPGPLEIASSAVKENSHATANIHPERKLSQPIKFDLNFNDSTWPLMPRLVLLQELNFRIKTVYVEICGVPQGDNQLEDIVKRLEVLLKALSCTTDMSFHLRCYEMPGQEAQWLALKLMALVVTLPHFQSIEFDGISDGSLAIDMPSLAIFTPQLKNKLYQCLRAWLMVVFKNAPFKQEQHEKANGVFCIVTLW